MKDEMRACDADEDSHNQPVKSGLDSAFRLHAEFPMPASSFHAEEKTMVDPFCYISEAQLRSLDSPIVCVITADAIQDCVQGSGSPLTDEELSVLRCAALLHRSDLFVEWLDELIEISRDFVQREHAFDSKVADLALTGLSDADIGKGLEHLDWTVADRRRNSEARTSQIPTNKGASTEK